MHAVYFLLKGPVVVGGNSFHQVHLSSGDTAYRSIPVVSNPHVKVPGVKVLKILVQWHKVLDKEQQKITFKKKKRDSERECQSIN